MNQADKSLTSSFFNKLQTATKISSLPLYRQALSLLKAVESSLQIKDISINATTQFGALIELIHESYNRLTIFFLITHLRPYLKDAAFQAYFSRLTQIVKIIQKPSPIVRKYSLNIIELLLISGIPFQQEEIATSISLFQKLILSLYDKEKMVRRQAIKSITNVITVSPLNDNQIEQQQSRNQFSNSLRDQVNKCFYRKEISSVELVCLLTQGIAVFLQVLPLKMSCQICEIFIQYAAECEDAKILALLYGAIQTFAQGRHDLIEYYAWIQDQIKELNEQTSVDLVEEGIHKSLAESAFVMAITALLTKLAKANKQSGFRLLPSAIATLSQFLLKPGTSTSKVALTSIQGLMELLLKKQIYKEVLNQEISQLSQSLALSKIHELKGVKASQISILDRIALLMEYLLEQRFQKVGDSILKIVKVFAKQVKGPELAKYSSEILIHGLLKFNYNRHSYQHWKQAIGQFIKSLGCSEFFYLVPLELTENSILDQNYSTLSKSYLLPFIGEYLEGEPLSFFGSYFIPIINKLGAQMKQANQISLKYKKLEVLIGQLWSLFPFFAKSTPIDNLDSSIVPLLRFIDSLVNENKYGCREVALQGLTYLMDLCMKHSASTLPSITKSRAGFKNLARKYIPFLKKLYLSMQTSELNSKRESKCILNCIRAFSAICKGGSVQKTIQSELERLLAAIDSTENQMNHQKMARNIEILLAFIESFAQLHSQKSKALATKIFFFAKAFLQKQEGVLVEKRVYKMIELLVSSYPVKQFTDFSYIYQEIQNIPLESVRKNRIKLIASLILLAQKFKGEVEETQRESFILTLIPEIIIGFKDQSTQTRKITEKLLLQISQNSQNSKKFTFKLLAGLASTTPRMKSATITGISVLVKSQKNQYSESEIKELVEIALYVIKGSDAKKDKESVRASLTLVKSVVKLLPQQPNTPFLQFLTRTLFHCSYFNAMKNTLRKIFQKLIKRYGLEQIKEVIPSGNEAFLVHTYKQMKREKKQEFIKNLDGAIEFQIKEIKNLKPWARAQKEGIDDQRVQIGSDQEYSSEEDDNQRRQNFLFSDEQDLTVPLIGKRKDSSHMEMEGDTQPSKRAKDFEQEVNKIFNQHSGQFNSHFTDDQQAALKGKRQVNLGRKQEGKEGIERDVVFDQEKNKFIISENKGPSLIGKRTKAADEDEQEQGEEIKDIEQRLANLMIKRKKIKEDADFTQNTSYVSKPLRRKEGHHVVESGNKFKSKDGRSDALRKGQMEPYAYIRLNPAMMNKRNRHEAVKSFEPVVGGGGLLKGLKIKKKR